MCVPTVFRNPWLDWSSRCLLCPIAQLGLGAAWFKAQRGGTGWQEMGRTALVIPCGKGQNRSRARKGVMGRRRGTHRGGDTMDGGKGISGPEDAFCPRHECPSDALLIHKDFRVPCPKLAVHLPSTWREIYLHPLIPYRDPQPQPGHHVLRSPQPSS